jgi:hypothetical protein
MHRHLENYHLRVAAVKDITRRWSEALDDTTQDTDTLRTEYATALKALETMEHRLAVILKSGRPLH